MATASTHQIFVFTLVGRTGSGKSATGNTILGGKNFTSKRVMKSVTKETSYGRSTNDQDELIVIDTPGLFDTDEQSTNEFILKEISKSVGVATSFSDGIDAFIIVLNSDERLTEESIKTLKFLRKLFGEDMMKYTIVLFTRRDQLDADEQTLDDFLETAPAFLREIVADCSGRVTAFDNRDKDDKKQVKDLIDMVKQIKRINRNVRYRNKVISRVKLVMDEDKKSYDSEEDDIVVAEKQAQKLTAKSSSSEESSGVLSTISSAIDYIVEPVISWFSGFF